MRTDGLARNRLWELAANQHGYVTTQQAASLGVSNEALVMLAQRGTILRSAFGVYRFPNFPFTEGDPQMLAVLWARVPESTLSHESALEVYEICDVNPNAYHVTVAKGRRLRRTGGEKYVVHYENLEPQQLGWWQEVPIVKPATAIAQCISYGTSTYLLRQAIERGYQKGRISLDEQAKLLKKLEGRDA